MHVKNKYKEFLVKLAFGFISILLISTQAIVVAQNNTESEIQYLGQKVF